MSVVGYAQKILGTVDCAGALLVMSPVRGSSSIWRLPGEDGCMLYLSCRVYCLFPGARWLRCLVCARRADGVQEDSIPFRALPSCSSSLTAFCDFTDDARRSVVAILSASNKFSDVRVPMSFRWCGLTAKVAPPTALAPSPKSCLLSCNTPCHASGQVLAACARLLVSAVRSERPAPASATVVCHPWGAHALALVLQRRQEQHVFNVMIDR